MRYTTCFWVVLCIMIAYVAPVGAVSPLPDYDFDKHTSDLTTSNLDLANIIRLVSLPYEDLMGSIFWGIVFALIFGVMWISIEYRHNEYGIGSVFRESYDPNRAYYNSYESQYERLV